MLFNSYRLAQKTIPLPPNNVGFPIAQTMGFAAVQHWIGGRGYKHFLNTVEMIVRK